MDTNLDLIVSSIDEDQQTLQARFHKVGYLHFKKYVAHERCDHLLQNFIQQLSPYIDFDTTKNLPVLKGQPFGETDNIWDEVYPKMQSLECFHQFFHQDDILNLMQTVVGTTPFIYPMKMARISTPGKKGYQTPPHQDAHSHVAGPTMAGIWVALHDVDETQGRLKMLAGSHKYGVRQIYQADGVGGVQCEIFPGEHEWHVSNVEQGDLIIFHSRCVHKAEANTADNTVRMSVDTRFCDFGAPIFSTNLEPHHGWRIEGFGWDSIYTNWQDKELQYYWKNYPNLF